MGSSFRNIFFWNVVLFLEGVQVIPRAFIKKAYMDGGQVTLELDNGDMVSRFSEFIDYAKICLIIILDKSGSRRRLRRFGTECGIGEYVRIGSRSRCRRLSLRRRIACED